MFRVGTETNMASVEGIPEHKFCTLCEESIIDTKNYRSLMSETTVCYYKYLQELEVSSNGYLCRFCLTKLNRLIRLDKDIETKLEALKKERSSLFSELKSIRKEIEMKMPSERPKLPKECGRLRKPNPRPVLLTCVNTKPPDMSKFKPILPLITQSHSADKESDSPSDSLSSSAVKNEINCRGKKRKSRSTEKDVEVKKMKTTASNSTKPQSLLQSGNDSVVPNLPVLLFRNINTVSDDTLPVHLSEGTCQAEKGPVGITTVMATSSEGISQSTGQSPLMLQKTEIRTNNEAYNIVTMNLSHIPEKNQVHAVDSEEAASQTTHQNNVKNPAFGVQHTQASVLENSEVERTGSLQYSHKASSHSSKEATPGYVSEGESSAKDLFSHMTWSNPKTENKSDIVQQNSEGDVCPETVKIKEEPEEGYYLPTPRTDGEDVTDEAEPQSVSFCASQMLCIKQEPKTPSNPEKRDIHPKSAESKLNCVYAKHVLSRRKTSSSSKDDPDVQEPKSPSNHNTCKSQDVHPKSVKSKLNSADAKHVLSCRKTSSSSKDDSGVSSQYWLPQTDHIPFSTLSNADVSATVDAQCTWKMKSKLLEKLKNKQQCGAKVKNSQESKKGDSTDINDSSAGCHSQCSSANSAVPALFADDHWLGHSANDKPITESTKQSSAHSCEPVVKCEQDAVSAVIKPCKQLASDHVMSLEVAEQNSDKAVKGCHRNSSKEGCAPRCECQRRGTSDHTSSETVGTEKGCVYTMCVKPDGKTKSMVNLQ